MAKIVWDRRENISNAISLIPPVVQASEKDFRPPATIEDDFRRLLKHDVPHVNFTFELLHDWYDIDNPEHEPVYIRAQQTPIDWKSKIGNSDMSTNFKTTHDIKIRKGDMVIREDGMVYMLNWNVTDHANNQATQSVECNATAEFTRWYDDETNELGHLVVPGGWRVVAPTIPISHTEYAGRPDFTSSQGLPGTLPDHLITVSVQWNDTTRDIRIDDRFFIGGYEYRVINVSIAEVNIDQDHGVVIMNAKKVAGGEVSDE